MLAASSGGRGRGRALDGMAGERRVEEGAALTGAGRDAWGSVRTCSGARRDSAGNEPQRPAGRFGLREWKPPCVGLRNTATREGDLRRSEPAPGMEWSVFADAAFVQVGVLLIEAQSLRHFEFGGGVEQLVGLDVVLHPADCAGAFGIEHDLGGDRLTLVVIDQQIGFAFVHVIEGEAVAAY